MQSTARANDGRKDKVVKLDIKAQHRAAGERRTYGKSLLTALAFGAVLEHAGMLKPVDEYCDRALGFRMRRGARPPGSTDGSRGRSELE